MRDGVIVAVAVGGAFVEIVVAERTVLGFRFISTG